MTGTMYAFAGVISVLVIASTTLLVMLGALNAEAYTLVIGTIVGGTFGVLNPRPPDRDPRARTRAIDRGGGAT